MGFGQNYPQDNEEALDLVRRENFAKAGELFDAAGENNFENVKHLLCYNDKSAEKIEFRKWYVNEKSWNDWIALHAAAEAGHTSIAQLLIECGSEINALSEVQYTPLHLGQCYIEPRVSYNMCCAPSSVFNFNQ